MVVGNIVGQTSYDLPSIVMKSHVLVIFNVGKGMLSPKSHHFSLANYRTYYEA